MSEDNLRNNNNSSVNNGRGLSDNYSSNNSSDKTSNQFSSTAKSVASEAANPSKWSDLITKLVDKLIGKDLQVTYSFDNLEIEIPKAEGPGGKDIGSVKWRINGSLTISAEILKNNPNSPQTI